jgi:hypothetical protein
VLVVDGTAPTSGLNQYSSSSVQSPMPVAHRRSERLKGSTVPSSLTSIVIIFPYVSVLIYLLIMQDPTPKPKKKRCTDPSQDITSTPSISLQLCSRDDYGGATIHSRIGLQELNGRRACLSNVVTHKLSKFTPYLYL